MMKISRFRWPGRSYRSHPQLGQVWRSSDPRRLSAFRIVDLTADVVTVEPVYPRGGLERALRLDAFLLTGSKGYTRIS